MLSFLVLATAFGHAQFNLVLPVGISQVSDIELGDIYNTPNTICTLSVNKRSGNACAPSTSMLGRLELQGNDGQSALIRVLGTQNTNVEFTPLLPNGTQQQLFDLSYGAAISIGGEIKVNSSEVVGVGNINYQIEINYQ